MNCKKNAKSRSDDEHRLFNPAVDILEEGTKEVSSGKESKAVIPTKPAKEKTIDEVSKKSIHARLQEKKNELAKKPGKDNPQRGVELA